MTNGEKARELSIKVMENGHLESNGACQRKQIENALKEIADWKEQQMIEVIGNLLFNKEEKIYTTYFDYDVFFEDLRKAMEDNL